MAGGASPGQGGAGCHRQRASVGLVGRMSEPSKWLVLRRLLRPEAPPEDMDLYVKPEHGCADAIVRGLLRDPATNPKFLLVGARGGGKSTELRAIRRGLGDHLVVTEIDLDRSGVAAASVTALDLLYISALALLRHLPTEEAKPLFDRLKQAYGEADADSLGDLPTALDGVAGFAMAAGGVALAAGAAAGGAPLIAGGLAVFATALRLLPGRRQVVAESSPLGRQVQSAAVEIARAVRTHLDGRPLCVLIDGLEKMNGQSAERFDEVFCHTRLLADPPWSAVIAAPPCTLTHTNSARPLGFDTRTVWGFNPDDSAALLNMLELRFRAAGLEPDEVAAAGTLTGMVAASGGMPRDAVQMVRDAVSRVLDDQRALLTMDDAGEGIRSVAYALGAGLREDDLEALWHLYTTKKMRGDEVAATLFSNGRILAYPPAPGSVMSRFAVHPLLVPDVERLGER